MANPSKQQCSNPLSPDNTPQGRLPPFEIAKAYAFDIVIKQMEKHMGKSACVLLGEDKGEFIASQVTVKGGGHPTATAVYQNLKKCTEPGWYPGKVHGVRTGRPADIPQHAKEGVAKVLMSTKRQLQRPTPAVARAKRPRLTVNPSTGKPISDWTIYHIMHTMCYDESEDDPWIYAYSPSKDYLSDGMKVARARCADTYMDKFSAGAWASQVSIDPCVSILANTKAMSDEQKVAAMGVKKMMSKKSKYKGPNCRAQNNIKSQGKDEIKVHWTPIFALGQVRVYVCDKEAAARDEALPTHLNDSQQMGKFIKNVLPGILEDMRDAYGWTRTPRTVVHDKASYLVAPRAQHLSEPFAAALRAAKLKSWLGDEDADCSWLAGRLGDVYVHETVISHLRHGLSHRFPRATPGETRNRFANRMAKVEEYLNSKEFATRDGGGLHAVAQAMRGRFERVQELMGERLRT